MSLTRSTDRQHGRPQPGRPHPDRLARNLAERRILLAQEQTRDEPTLVPGPGSADARMDLKVLCHAVHRALQERGTEAARQRLGDLQTRDLWAGTVQDGTARGFRVALEEALSLCRPQAGSSLPDLPIDAEVIEGKDLARRREVLCASGGPRVRFSRKGGILWVDRRAGIHAENCILFEDRTDVGDLDGFVPKPGERPRLFSPAFLKPVRVVHAKTHDQLVLEGRLGPRRHGYPCRMEFTGRKDERLLRLRLTVQNAYPDHRLRIRFLGFTDAAYFIDTDVMPAGFPPCERIEYRGRRFLAATVVRACGRLRVGDEVVAVPDAQVLGETRLDLACGRSTADPACGK